ncbi:TPA: hypothetical protein ACOEBE_000231 [Stenotrophomonas maltophilia]
MSNDKTTLADVQPGGRVRLGVAPWPEIDAILADAYSAGAEGLPFEGIARRAAVRKAVAALSAQPSPGGQDALHEAVGRIFGCDGSPWRTRDVAAVLRDYAALAARQPVGEPTVVAHRYIQRHQSAEHSVWLSGDADETYVEAERQGLGRIERAYAAPPAQAVDLGAMPDGWRLSKKTTCYQLSHGNEIIGNLVGPAAEANAAIIARVLDSQAVGNG